MALPAKSTNPTPLVLLLALFFCCNVAFAAPITLFVTIPPQLEAAKFIAGDRATVHSLVPPGASPETFTPDARTIGALGKAQLFFTIGAPCEKALLPRLRSATTLQVVDCRKDMKILEWEGSEKCHHHHHHGEKADNAAGHDHSDPHVWLDPENLAAAAITMGEALAKLDPAHGEEYRQRATQHANALKECAQNIAKMLSPYRGRNVLVYHPAFGYLLRPYGLNQLAVEAGGHEPTGAQLQRLIRKIRREKITTVFVQPQFNPRPVRTIARECGCAIVEIDPLPAAPLKALPEIAREIAQSFAP